MRRAPTPHDKEIFASFGAKIFEIRQNGGVPPLKKTAGLRARRFTEADLRLYPTIIRYDGAYATLFKCCRKRIADYPNLSGWLRDVYQLRTQGSSQLQVRAQLPAISSGAVVRQLSQEMRLATRSVFLYNLSVFLGQRS